MQPIETQRVRVLSKLEDWHASLAYHKATADKATIWDFCNPDLEASAVKKLEDKPTMPTRPVYPESGTTERNYRLSRAD